MRILQTFSWLAKSACLLRTEIVAAQGKFEALGSQRAIAQCLQMLGQLRHLQGDTDDALRRLQTTPELFSTLRDRLGLAYTAWYIRLVRCDWQELDEATTELKEAQGLYMELGLQKDVEGCDELIAKLHL